MAGKLVGFRIPEALGPVLEMAAKRAGIRESRYVARLLVRHLRRIEGKHAPIDASRGGCPVNGHVWFSQGEPTPDSLCLCGAMTYAKGPVPVIRADAVEEQAND